MEQVQEQVQGVEQEEGVEQEVQEQEEEEFKCPHYRRKCMFVVSIC